jgi:hypothetical protein
MGSLPSASKSPLAEFSIYSPSMRPAEPSSFWVGWLSTIRTWFVKLPLAGTIACHSYAHCLVYDLTPAEFVADTKRAVAAIEDACESRPGPPGAQLFHRDASMWARNSDSVRIYPRLQHLSDFARPLRHSGLGSNARTLPRLQLILKSPSRP